MKLKNDNNFKYWFWFAENHLEELYDILSKMIDERIEEKLPEKVQEQMRQFSVDIQTTINGKSSSDLRGIIISELEREF